MSMIQVIYKNKMLLLTFLRRGASLSFHFSNQVEANFCRTYSQMDYMDFMGFFTLKLGQLF